MARITDFMPYVMPSVPGCSDPMAEKAIRDTCIDFCARTLIVQKALDPVSVVAGQTMYEFETDTGTAVAMVLMAWFKDRPLKLTTLSSPLRPSSYGESPFGGSALSGEPRHLTQLSGTSFSVDAAPEANVANAISIFAALKPTVSTETVDDILLNDYAYEIGQGAISRLAMLPKEPFSDLNLAVAANNIYNAARNATQIVANKMRSRGEDRIVVPII